MCILCSRGETKVKCANGGDTCGSEFKSLAQGLRCENKHCVHSETRPVRSMQQYPGNTGNALCRESPTRKEATNLLGVSRRALDLPGLAAKPTQNNDDMLNLPGAVREHSEFSSEEHIQEGDRWASARQGIHGRGQSVQGRTATGVREARGRQRARRAAALFSRGSDLLANFTEEQTARTGGHGEGAAGSRAGQLCVYICGRGACSEGGEHGSAREPCSAGTAQSHAHSFIHSFGRQVREEAGNAAGRAGEQFGSGACGLCGCCWTLCGATVRRASRGGGSACTRRCQLWQHGGEKSIKRIEFSLGALCAGPLAVVRRRLGECWGPQGSKGRSEGRRAGGRGVAGVPVSGLVCAFTGGEASGLAKTGRAAVSWRSAYLEVWRV